MTDKNTSDNLINIIDQRHLFGIKEPKDIRFAIKTVSKILHYQNRGYPLLRRAPKIVEKPKLYYDDLALYVHESDVESLTTLFNKEKDTFD